MKIRSNVQVNNIFAENIVFVSGSVSAPFVCCCMCCSDTDSL